MTAVHIKATGEAHSEFDYATVQVSIYGDSNTGVAAKENTQKVSKQLFNALKTLQERGANFRDKELRTSFKVGPKRIYSTELSIHEFKGYRATFTVTITINDISQVGIIQDALTSINGVEVESPKLHLKKETSHRLEQEAFEQAFLLAQTRFNHQTSLLGLRSNDFSIISWNSQYKNDQNHRGKFASLEEDSLEFHAGVASVNLEVTFTFDRKES